MYIPRYYQETDLEVLKSFMNAFPFAVMVSIQNQRPMATHLPFVVMEGEAEQGIRLVSHLSSANPQWKEWADQEVMVIFSEPHAYISPSHYSNPQSVPTWNYMAIHAYGRVTDLEGEDASAVLEAMIQAFEPEYLAKWKDMPEKFVSGMMAGIRAFEIQVTELQGKRKLSQNKPLQDQEKIAAHLLESQDTVIQWIGKEMMQQLNDHSQPE